MMNKYCDFEALELEGENCDEYAAFDWHIQRQLDEAAKAIEECFMCVTSDVSASHVESVSPSIFNAYGAVLLAYDPGEYSTLLEKAKGDPDVYIGIMKQRRGIQ